MISSCSGAIGEPELHFFRRFSFAILCHVSDLTIFLAYSPSLKATWIKNTILHALSTTTPCNIHTIEHNFVYANHTITRLGKWLARLIDGTAAAVPEDQRPDEMLAMVKKHSSDFISHQGSVKSPSGAEVYLVTGTTGSFGSYLLAALLRLPTTTKVYALNRPGSTPLAERQQEAFVERGLDATLLKSKALVLLEGNLTLSTLNIDPEVFITLQQEVTCIIHNG
jgi:hypothetical protein